VHLADAAEVWLLWHCQHHLLQTLRSNAPHEHFRALFECLNERNLRRKVLSICLDVVDDSLQWVCQGVVRVCLVQPEDLGLGVKAVVN
jgi:hypothetical protein